MMYNQEGIRPLLVIKDNHFWFVRLLFLKLQRNFLVSVGPEGGDVVSAAFDELGGLGYGFITECDDVN
jgi:hypothetical protein